METDSQVQISGGREFQRQEAARLKALDAMVVMLADGARWRMHEGVYVNNTILVTWVLCVAFRSNILIQSFINRIILIILFLTSLNTMFLQNVTIIGTGAL